MKMNIKPMKYNTAQDVEAVITSFNQGAMILEAVHSLCVQTTVPGRIIIVDDGSTEDSSVNVLQNIESDPNLPVPVVVLKKANEGVSAARNTGIDKTQSPMVLVLDGDDKLEPSYIEQVSRLLRENPSMAAASSWMKTFGVLEAVVRPSGGDLTAFLSRNCCPASHILRRGRWEQCGGYDETMRDGFEDWDYFLSTLETAPDAYIGMIEKPLINYRTAPVSSNLASMTKRLDLMRYLIEKHISSYRDHIAEALLGLEAVSIARLNGWESEIIHTMEKKQEPCRVSKAFMEDPSFGDGGVAAAVRIQSADRGAQRNEVGKYTSAGNRAADVKKI